MTGQISGVAIEAYRHLGPGLVESAYDVCLAYVYLKNLKVERQQLLPITNKGVRLSCDYRINLIIQNEVFVKIISKRSGTCS